MQSLTRHRTPLLPLVAVLAVIAIAIGTQVLRAVVPAARVPSGVAEARHYLTGEAPPAAVDPVEELARIRGDVAFWSARLTKQPRDTTAAVELATSSIELARATGDVTAYLKAQAAADAALAASPGYLPATGIRASVLIALHKFDDARMIANGMLADDPDDAVGLGVLADASIELGDLTAARTAIQHLSTVGGGAAADIRRSRIAFLTGDAVTAVNAARDAVQEAIDDGSQGSGLAFYDTTLGDLLASTGDAAGATAAYRAAIAARPGWPAALSGLGRQAFARGDLDTAIADYDQAIATIPFPDSLARRADLEALRNAPGDAKKSADDLATVEAIAKLAGDAAYVYDRTLVLFLADHGQDPERAVRMADVELAVRKDVYGYDADAWALLAAGRVADADAAMHQALAAGTRDPKLLYHAGMIALAAGRPAEAKTELSDALALDPGFDPLGATRARQALATLP
jgi:tetratricopeptide (TPR) repeat protein